MFRHHRILYRKLLRGQSAEELTQLRADSAAFPTLLQLIDDELERRGAAGVAAPGAVAGLARPIMASSRLLASS